MRKNDGHEGREGPVYVRLLQRAAEGISTRSCYGRCARLYKLSQEIERNGVSIRLRAERRIGELLKEMKKTGERKGRGGSGANQRGNVGRRDISTPKLSDLGLTRDESSKAQKLADVPEEDFEAALANDSTMTTADGVINRGLADGNASAD
jgi:hypothetical protein